MCSAARTGLDNEDWADEEECSCHCHNPDGDGNDVWQKYFDDLRQWKSYLARELDITLDRGCEFAYDSTDEGSVPPERDWAHRAARGIVYDLRDRRGPKSAFNNIDAECRTEIIETIAALIRRAKEQDGEKKTENKVL